MDRLQILTIVIVGVLTVYFYLRNRQQRVGRHIIQNIVFLPWVGASGVTANSSRLGSDIPINQRVGTYSTEVLPYGVLRDKTRLDSAATSLRRLHTVVRFRSSHLRTERTREPLSDSHRPKWAVHRRSSCPPQ